VVICRGGVLPIPRSQVRRMALRDPPGAELAAEEPVRYRPPRACSRIGPCASGGAGRGSRHHL